MLGSGFLEGQHVVARKELHAGFFSYPVHKGARGVVLQRPVGIFSDRYVVSFPSGQATVRGRDLKPTLIAPGSDVAVGVRWGWWLFLLIPLIPAVKYLLAGGSVSGLIAAVPSAIVETVVSLANRGIGLLGLPTFLIVLAALWLWFRHVRH